MAANAETLPAAVARVLADDRQHGWDSHPPLRERIANFEAAARAGAPEPPWSPDAAAPAYDLLGGKGSRWSVTPFVRYEALDTQDRVPAGYERDPGNNRRSWTAGIGVKPLPQVVLKADYQWLSNGAKTGRNQLNLGLGYLF